MSENYHSYHIFMFPFSLDRLNPVYQKLFPEDKTTSGDNMNLYNWVQSDTETDKVSKYNVGKYFHDHAESCLFPESKNPLIRKYYRNDCKNWKYIITVNKRKQFEEKERLFEDQVLKPPDNYYFEKNPKDYVLIIDKVTLDIFYKQGVGIFSFHLKNTEYFEPYDILLINQFGRRTYPPFLDKTFINFKPELSNELDGVQHRELPVSIILRKPGGGEICENFKPFSEKHIDPPRNYLPEHIKHFFMRTEPDNSGEFPEYAFGVISDECHCKSKCKCKPKSIKITQVLDDRMFVISWYGAEQLTYHYKCKRKTYKQEVHDEGFRVSDLCQRQNGGYEVTGVYRNDKRHRSLALNSRVDSYGYANNKFWYQYVFVDGYGPSIANEMMWEQQILEHTYARWVEANTLYGITRYSFVCITEPKDNLQNSFPNACFLINHVQTIYFRMVSLVLAQRAMFLIFSQRAKDASLLITDKKTEKDAIQKIEQLTKDYSVFTNGIFHSEITDQDQGIEMYDLFLRHLRIDQHVKELEKEIEGLHNTASLIASRDTNSSIEKLTLIGALLVIPNLILSFTGSTWFTDSKTIVGWKPWGSIDSISSLQAKPQLFVMFIVIVLTMGLAFFLLKEKDKNNIKFLVVSIGVIIMLLLLFFPLMLSLHWILIFATLALIPLIFIFRFEIKNKFLKSFKRKHHV